MLSPEKMAILSTLLSEPHRKYHNLNHIHQCLLELNEYAEAHTGFTLDQHQWAELALWYHDAIYNPYSKTNEHDSMMLWERTPTAMPGTSIVSNAILNTARHLQTINFEHEDPRTAEVYQVVLDIDLAGFGKDRMVFALNGMNIRQEYYQTSLRDFLVGRQKFYEQLIKRPTLYYTEYFRDQYHDKSRSNIRWEMSVIEQTLNGGQLSADHWRNEMDEATRLLNNLR